MLIVVCIPCLLLGGTEVATLGMVRALTAAGHQVIVVCFFESDEHMVGRYRESGAEVRLLGLTRNGLSGLIHLFNRLVRLLRELKPDAVHVQYMAPGMVPILAARFAGIRNVFSTVHAAGRAGYSGKARTMFTFSASMVSHFFCVSRNAEAFWFGQASTIDAPGDRQACRHSTIYNGVDTRMFSPGDPETSAELKAALGIPSDQLVIGISGRVVQLKGHDLLLQALAQLETSNLHLLVLGDGPDRARFEALATELGLGDRVTWAGRIEPESMAEHYQLMALFAMPSRWEGFGLTAAEAMATAIPVVASKVPGLAEVVEDGVTGILVPVDDPSALANALNHLIRDHAQRQKMGDAGRQRVLRLFDQNRIAQQWQDSYAALLKNPADMKEKRGGETRP